MVCRDITIVRMRKWGVPTIIPGDYQAHIFLMSHQAAMVTLLSSYTWYSHNSKTYKVFSQSHQISILFSTEKGRLFTSCRLKWRCHKYPIWRPSGTRCRPPFLDPNPKCSNTVCIPPPQIDFTRESFERKNLRTQPKKQNVCKSTLNHPIFDKKCG